MNEETNTYTPQTPNKNSSGLWSILKEVVIFAIIAFGIVIPFRMLVAEPYVVSGESMSPTFESGDYLIVEKLSLKNGVPQRNDVIVFKFPNPNDTISGQRNLIKRVIGLPGETVSMRNSVVTIINKENPDGFNLDEKYITNLSPDSFSITLNEDEYFVMGDNRLRSYDSRSWGVLKKEYMVGKPVFRLFPVNQIGINPGQIK